MPVSNKITVREDADGIVKRHRFDIQRRQDGFFIRECGVVITGDLCREDDAHVAQIDIDSSQVRST